MAFPSPSQDVHLRFGEVLIETPRVLLLRHLFGFKVALDNLVIPDGVKVLRFRFRKERDLGAITAAIVIVAGVERLRQVANKMNQVAKGFGARSGGLAFVAKKRPLVIDRADDTSGLAVNRLAPFHNV